MMQSDFDVIIVGSGPSGVSAAFPLVRSGLKVLMVDGGQKPNALAPDDDYLSARMHGSAQAEWMLGKNFHALHPQAFRIPKLRVPTHEYVFKDFLRANRIQSENFTAVGSLATGGLSNAWGCGVARLSPQECRQFPFPYDEIQSSYEHIAKRIGVSGAIADDLSAYFGLDQWAQPPIMMDRLHTHLNQRYLQKKKQLAHQPFLLGRTRMAVLSESLEGREACQQLANCFWGCRNKSLYNASDELTALNRYPNLTHLQGFIVEQIAARQSLWVIEGTVQSTQEKSRISARKIILALGTLASTSLVVRALKLTTSLSLYSNPNAVFLLWLPRLLNNTYQPSLSGAQLSFTLKLNEALTALGSTFPANTIPSSEFLSHLPLRRSIGIDLLKTLVNAFLIGNVMLPSSLSKTTLSLKANGTVLIQGAYHPETDEYMWILQKQLRRIFLTMGAIMLPRSFKIGAIGSDLHYVGTLPMRKMPDRGETGPYGEVHGLEGVYVVDGACLPIVTEKFHTLTMMANADRIARHLVESGIGTN